MTPAISVDGRVVLKKIIVYGRTVEVARRKLEELMKEIPEEDILRVISHRYGLQVKLHDGTLYVAIKGDQKARGHRHSYAYIDAEIEADVIENDIIPYGPPGEYQYYWME